MSRNFPAIVAVVALVIASAVVLGVGVTLLI